jgi:heme oxygenase (biliverdin-IX-beta and delta-forming)
MTLQRLKLATRERHAAIESRSVLLDPQLSLPAYYDTLTRFFGYYAPLEDRLADALTRHGADIDYDERYKCPQLRRDLLTLGATPQKLARIHQFRALPDLSTPAELFGCLYVIEGATLGGQIITRHLRSSLGLTPEAGAAFFSGYGERTGSRWKEFCTQLSSFAASADKDHEIVASANATFEFLHRWLYPAPQSNLTHYELAEHTEPDTSLGRWPLQHQTPWHHAGHLRE